ncbi:MAG: FtsX-like permease family protein [Oscillospiraceae bacterium]|nr:FtsX-like permease family protein [Oscillospiraceae bacterium]
MNRMISGIKDTASVIVMIVLGIVFLLMAIIYINRTLGRQYEIAVMKANGLKKLEINRVALSEALLHIILVAVLAVVMSVGIMNFINLIFSFELVSSLSVVIPVLGSLLIMNRVKPDRLLRN